MRRFIILTFLSVLATTGCGGGARPAPSAYPANTTAPDTSASVMRESSRPGPYAEAPVSPAPTPSPSGVPSIASRGLALSDAIARFYRLEAVMLTSRAQCDIACRSLDSMTRAADEICRLATTEEEHVLCDTAQKRVRDSRERVRAECPHCQ